MNKNKQPHSDNVTRAHIHELLHIKVAVEVKELVRDLKHVFLAKLIKNA